ncbi:hypothetical protein QCA50_002317 [Cerrena zonata]|uniref:Structural maintenance of chromosomes protein 4 n=1 Tax=Cerrena zonata TaxID=2478898 RepID=A0AAW0GXR4_9APHY
MPPRRSTRSASVQPPPASEKPAPAKRKRGQLSEEVLADTVNTKPPSRSRKPPSRAASSSTKSRAQARPSLDDVPESDVEHDEEDSPPPVKKPRPSIGDDDDFAPEEDEVPKPSRSRRAPARKAPIKKEESESEEEVKPPRRNSRIKAPAATARPSRKVSAKAAKAPDSEDEAHIPEASDDSGPEALPPPKRAPRGAKVKVASKSSTPASQLPSRRGGRSSAIPKPEPIEETLPEPSVEPELQPSEDEEKEGTATPSGSGKPMEPEPTPEEEPYEEEHSLLDDIRPPPPKATQQPVIPEEPQGPKPRLVIHKMALINFKSYAGRQEIGPFHKSFSAIVGPNGSGKSNTIDALLFVFGYRASKMRQGKLSELIHNSARHPDLPECSVEVHFRDILDEDGPDAFSTIPGSTLVVARTAYKNNSSRYTINGRSSTYSEVQKLLKGKGIDLDHNRFLILQGEVESIAQMKPKAPSEHEDGLLEYLEDIIGTSNYKEPIEQAMHEVERLNEERVEKLNRLKIVERERNALEEQKREAEDYLRLQNEHIRALSRLWQWYIWRCLLGEEKFTEQIKDIEKELAEETEHNQEDIDHLEALEKHFKERSATYEEVKVAATEAMKDLTAHEKKQVSLEERRKHANTKTKKLKKSLQEDEHAHAEALRAIDDNGSRIKKGKSKADALEADLAKEEKVLEEIRDSLKDKTQVFHDQIEVKQKELQPWTAKINAKQAEIDVATSERDMLAQKAEQVKKTFETAKGDLERLQTDHESKSTELDELQARKGETVKEVKTAERRFQELQGHVQELRSKASSSRQRVDEAKASQAASTSQNKVLDTLTKLKNTGRISGFHGRLGSLGTIPNEYDVAVSTAGGSLNNLVVDTVEQGQKLYRVPS